MKELRVCPVCGCVFERMSSSLNFGLYIETYARYWHPDNYEETRHKKMHVDEDRILFLSEDDLHRKDWEEHCLKEINDFTSRFADFGDVNSMEKR